MFHRLYMRSCGFIEDIVFRAEYQIDRLRKFYNFCDAVAMSRHIKFYIVNLPCDLQKAYFLLICKYAFTHFLGRVNMNLENANKVESSFLFVALFPAGIIFIYLLYLLSYVFVEYDTFMIFRFLSSKHYSLLVLLLFSYIASMFIHGIRYVGFMWYETFYDKKIKNMGTNILFWLFRKGTVVEECLTQYKNDSCSYEWINEAKKQNLSGADTVKKMWQLAARINKEQYIYQFYFYSEIFQCCYTVFIFMCLLQSFPILYLLIHKKINATIFNLVLRPVFLFIALISRSIAIAFARRFLFDIENKRKITN